MIPHIDRFLSEPASELGNVRYSDMVKRPKKIFIEPSGTFQKPNFNTIC